MRGGEGVGGARPLYRGAGDAVPPVGGQHLMGGVRGSVDPAPRTGEAGTPSPPWGDSTSWRG